jgi:hypothetical protein
MGDGMTQQFQYQLYKMLKNILDLLPLVKHSDGELISIAKGKNEIPNTLKKFKWQLLKK